MYVLAEPRLYNLNGSFPQYHQSLDCWSLIPLSPLSQDQASLNLRDLPGGQSSVSLGWSGGRPVRGGGGEREDPPPLFFSPGLRPRLWSPLGPFCPCCLCHQLFLPLATRLTSCRVIGAGETAASIQPLCSEPLIKGQRVNSSPFSMQAGLGASRSLSPHSQWLYQENSKWDEDVWRLQEGRGREKAGPRAPPLVTKSPLPKQTLYTRGTLARALQLPPENLKLKETT